MEILGYVSFIPLLFFGITLIFILRKNLKFARGGATTAILLLISIIVVVVSNQYIISLPLLFLSIILPRKTFFYRIPILSDIISFIASFYLSIIRIGIPKEKIMEGIDQATEDMLREFGIDESKIPPMMEKVKNKNNDI